MNSRRFFNLLHSLTGVRHRTGYRHIELITETGDRWLIIRYFYPIRFLHHLIPGRFNFF